MIALRDMRRTPLAGARATERVVRMRTAQGGKLPGPYLDVAAPAGMMQLRHRESVVQFINEVVQFINEAGLPHCARRRRIAAARLG